MERNADILKELTSLSPTLAGLDKTNVFSVPEGYFDSVSSTVLVCLSGEEGIYLKEAQAETGVIPEGYFDQLPGSVLNKIKAGESAGEEIRNLSPLLYHIKNRKIFHVPNGYFDSLPDIIFGSLEKSLLNDELKEIAPLLYGLRDKHVFQAPDSYFSGVADNVLRKVSQQPAPVVKMAGRRLFVKYAAAAVLSGMTLIGGYKCIHDSNRSQIAENRQAIASLDASIEKGKNMDDEQFNETLNNLRAADVASYLEKNGDVADVGAIGTYVDDNSLPSEDDYLLDERTLENYLKKIEKSTNN